jgi:hypothetical protein
MSALFQPQGRISALNPIYIGCDAFLDLAVRKHAMLNISGSVRCNGTPMIICGFPYLRQRFVADSQDLDKWPYSLRNGLTEGTLIMLIARICQESGISV